MKTDAERINTLRDCLQDVYYYGHQLDGLADRAAAEPAPDAGLPGGWPDLLSDVNDALKPWWTARDEAIAAVDDLDDRSGHLFYRPDDPMLDRWTTKVRSWLMGLPGDWLSGTYTERHGTDVMRFVRAKKPARWADDLAAHVHKVDLELHAVEAADSSKVTASPGPMLDTTHDTNNDTPKKKPRTMSGAAITVSRQWRDAFLAGDETIAIRRVAEDYIENGGSGKASSIVRTLNDNPDQWKDHPDIVAVKTT